MILNIVMLILSLAAILVGANMLVDGSSALARRFGMSSVTVGLTVVAFGTSAPELTITVLSSLRGASSLAVGNVVGSNIFNILVIIGLTAMIRPLRIDKSVMSRQMPMMVLSSLVLLMLGNSVAIDGTPAEVISRTSGIFLLLLFALFMLYTVVTSRVHPDVQRLPAGTHSPMHASPKDNAHKMPLWKQAVWILVGLAGLIWGGDRFVDSASGLARLTGMSEAMIGLTIVAAGTSLPELAASAVAAVKGNPGLAVGNVIGSNIFNVSLVLGAGATCAPLTLGTIGNPDLLVLVGASLVFWIMGRVWGHSIINRAEGAILFLSYIGYTVWLISAL